MHPHLLATHNVLRWVILVLLIISLVQAYTGWLGNKPFTKAAAKVRTFTTSLVHLQLIIGFVLYFVSPLVKTFLENVGGAMKDKELRFFGMEHTLMMILVVVFVTIGSAKSKRQTTDIGKYKAIAIWFSIALLLIFVAAPSEFSPMNYRPNFRGY